MPKEMNDGQVALTFDLHSHSRYPLKESGSGSALPSMLRRVPSRFRSSMSGTLEIAPPSPPSPAGKGPSRVRIVRAWTRFAFCD